MTVMLSSPRNIFKFKSPTNCNATINLYGFDDTNFEIRTLYTKYLKLLLIKNGPTGYQTFLIQ